MSTTTEILFNSPALHSLKREQLVKLCKIHSIKASGKNVDLIHKLRLHARTLPKDSPLSIAARSEEHGPIPMQLESPENDEKETDQEMSDDASYQSSRPPRPSEQWEMVMDSIEELEEEGSSQGTLTSMRNGSQGGGGTGEFGTGGSRSTTVSSSIKAIATSLGLKRANAKSASISSTTSITMPKNPAFPAHPVHQTPDELSQMSTPYSSLPESTSLPQTDHFTLNDMDTRMSIGGNTEVPLPGTVLRPGVPAPANARLSMGLNGPSTPTRPTTTIRLISNPLSNLDHTTTSTDPSYHNYGAGENGTPQLKPFQTTFDITFGSPAPLPLGASAFNFGSLSTWPPRGEEDDADQDVQMTGLYPTLSLSDLPPSIEPKLPGTPSKPGDVGVHVHLRPNSHSQSQSHSHSLNAPRSPDLFVFGTPHKVTDDQFRSAAASVLEDLNRQLREDGVEELGQEIIAKLHPAASKEKARKESLANREIKPLPGGAKRAGGEITDRFQKMHEEEFEKMEGIDSIVRRRNERMESQSLSLRQRKALGDGDGEENETERVVVGKKRKSSVVAGGKAHGPRRPSGFAPRRASNTRVISNGRRAKALPGAFGLDDDDDDDDEAVQEEEGRGGKRIRVDPESPTAGGTASPSPEEQEMEKRRLELEREKEAIRKKLEANRARRRSSAAHGGLSARKSGRVSVGRPRPSVLVKPKPKPSRFGFLSSAKSLVQSVWNRGKAPAPSSAAAATAGPSQIPKPTTATTTTTSTKPESLSKPTGKEKGKDKMGQPPSMLLSKKRASVAPARPTHLVASGSRVASGSASASSSTRSRSPLPPTFTGTGTGTGASSSRNSFQSNVGTRTGTRSRTTSSNASSMGTRVSTTSSANPVNRASNVGSMGNKIQNVGGGVAVGNHNRNSVASRTSTTSSFASRLYAPTASSLAKMARSTPLGHHHHQRTGSGSGSGVPAQKPSSMSTTTNTTLGSITNSPTVVAPSSLSSHPHSPAMSQSSTLFSPRQHQQVPGRIFSKPLLLPTQQQSGIPVPTPVKRRQLGTGTGNDEGNVNVNDTPRAKEDQMQAKPSAFVRTHSLNGRKPRISRSKVIARLASQREAGGGGGGGGRGGESGSGTTRTGVAGIAPRKSAGKNRSSLGAKVSSRGRASGGVGGGALGAVAMSAKKRARQSEYARRRSKVGSPALDLSAVQPGASGRVGPGPHAHGEADMD